MLAAATRLGLTGISEGLKAQGVLMNPDDVVALNAFQELPDYTVPRYDSRDGPASR